MNYYKAIGGYFAFDEVIFNALPHMNSLNTGRNCLTYILKRKNIKKLLAPVYTCPIVWRAIQAAACAVIPYDAGEDFLPECRDYDSPILYTNYFGICGKQADYVLSRFRHVIMDNAQAFYSKSRGEAAFYSPRKFFPLPDGGLLWPSASLPEDMERDESWSRCAHLLKRADLGPEAGYADYARNEKSLDDLPVKKMSRLTASLLAGMDLEKAREIRLENFRILHERLGKRNLLRLDPAPDDVPMVYPFGTKDAGLREKLIARRVYAAKYWREDGKTACMASPKARGLAETIIPLPLDQRYGRDDMEYMLKILETLGAV